VALRVHLDTSAYTAFLRNDETAVFVVERAPMLALSPVVIGELKAGFALGSRRRENLQGLARFTSSARVTPVVTDERVTDRYALIYKQLRQDGTPIPTNDLWIAACVASEGEALFALDAHFERVLGLPLVQSKEDLRRLLS
jgi:tRNA(fMet)-specific endonuclease VapC